MTLVELAEKIHQVLDEESIKSTTIRADISELIDLAFQAINAQSESKLNEDKMHEEMDKLLMQLSKKQRQILRIQGKWQRELERIELLLYEKNEYKLLQDVIDYVKACKVNTIKNASFCESTISQINPNEEAFYCSNSMNIQNNFIIQNDKVQDVVQAINKSSISLSQKEQLVYNIMKSQTNQSQLLHVNLDDILDISYNPVSKKLNTSILSSIPIQTDKSAMNFNKQGKFVPPEITIDLEEQNASPKFQFSELSPIRSEKKQNDFWVDSFQKPASRAKIQVPRINLAFLTDARNTSSQMSASKLSSSLKKKIPQTRKRPQNLSYCEKTSFQDKGILNLIANKSRDTKDTDNRRTDSNNSRPRNQTFHSAQPQSQFLRELMSKMHNKQVPPENRKRVSLYEKKQLSILISKLKKKE